MIIESHLPKELWTYAVQTAFMVRNRCFNNRTKQTPYFMLTGKQPNLAKMQKFGSVCYAYRQDKRKLDPRCDKGIFVGYDKNSPAYLVYYPSSGKVQKHRLVKCVTPTVAEHQTQTEMPADEVLRRVDRARRTLPLLPTGQTQEQKPVPTVGPQESQAQPIKQETGRYPSRVRRKPDYYGDHVTEASDEQVQITIDYCYRLVSNVPLTFSEAVTSPNSKEWSSAMDEEMESLNDNNTFTLTTLPEGKKAVGGRWVYALKTNADGSTKFKARYVAKGYSQKQGVDYDETFSPTANLTSVRVLMQKAAQENLILHQMDVKTAYLHAPIDFEIYSICHNQKVTK